MVNAQKRLEFLSILVLCEGKSFVVSPCRSPYRRSVCNILAVRDKIKVTVDKIKVTVVQYERKLILARSDLRSPAIVSLNFDMRWSKMRYL